MNRPRLLPLALACLLAAGCGASADGTGDGSTPSTIGGIGAVPPGTGPAGTGTEVVELTLPESLGTLPGGVDVTVPETAVGQRVLGNRLLMIGDSITAGTSRRYGGEACDTLVPLGWQVAVEAESGRFVGFGDEVLDARLTDGWDAAVVFLGTNYDGDALGYEADLADILDRLAPRPVVLLTTTVFRPMQAEVNDAIARQVTARENVDLIDWSTISELPGVLSSDGIHPTDAGRQLYIDALALVLGAPPVQPGDCLTSEFTDDSAVPGAPGGPGGMTTAPSGGTSGSPTTQGGVVATTPAPTAAPTTGAPPVTSAPPVETTAAPTVPPTTVPVATTAATTAPPTTAAPTLPPTTAAPTTAAPTLPVPSVPTDSVGP